MTLLNEYGNEINSHIILHNKKRCEYKVNRKEYYESGLQYNSIYDMENGAALYDTVMEHLKNAVSETE